MNRYTHIGRLFYFDADIPSDVTDVSIEVWDNKARQTRTVKAKKILWKLYWLTPSN